MKRAYIILLLAVCCTAFFLSIRAKEKVDTAFQSMLQKYDEVYKAPNKEKQFFELSNRIRAHYLEQKDYSNYYDILLNQALYKSEHGKVYEAIKEANDMMSDMKSRNISQYEKVYTALGNIYENRGNIRMAEHYYLEALKDIKPSDRLMLANVYSHLAYLQMFVHPDEAASWNEKLRNIADHEPNYLQFHYFVKAGISFYQGDKQGFNSAYNDYQDFLEQQQDRYSNYGLYTLQLMKKAVDGNYKEALKMTSEAHAKNEINNTMEFDLRAKIYEMQGNMKEVIDMLQKRRNMRDSLNSDMLFNNINEINAQLNMYQLKHETSKRMQLMSIVIIVLAFITIIILVFWIMRFRKLRKQLINYNEALKTALHMAEESDKMKTEFVRQVSHEIRTPLNAINGFNELLNNPDIALNDEERKDLLARIKENMDAITNIIDEMLHMANQTSNSYSMNTTSIYCNQFLSPLIYNHREKVSGSVELLYKSKLINRDTIYTDPDGLRKIIDQLMNNAIKFTQRGFIELACEYSEDKHWVLISVTDTGRGVTEEQREKIFTPFHKADSFQQGIGLGLSISKKIAQRLGGDLMLDTDYTEGARFVLKIPANTQQDI
jgi:signal transduction histidine kinase